MEIIMGNVAQIQRLLLIDFNESQYEKFVAHYTKPDVLFSLLKNSSPFRLNVVDFMNDPSENKILSHWLAIDDKLTKGITAFLASFTFNCLSLNQYRIYGLENNKHGSGINIEFGADFFCQEENKSSISDDIMDTNQGNLNKNANIFPLPLYRCLYFNPNTGYVALAKRSKQSFYDKLENELPLDIDRKYEDYVNYLNEAGKINSIRTELYKMKEAVEQIFLTTNENLSDLISLAITPISYLIKNSYYEDENECRVAYITTISDTKIVTAENYQNIDLFYVPYTVSKEHIKAINMGPQIDLKHKLWLENYIKKGKYGIKIGQADMPIK